MEKEIEVLFDRLWPINRSITGNGVRESLKILSEYLPLNISEIPSGTQVFDWIIPKEWNAIDAYIISPEGKKIASFKENNLHLLGYSLPLKTFLPYEELIKHIYTIPEQPDVIPYLTSYYKDRWGFCLSHNQFLELTKEGLYEVVIETSLNPSGSMTYADVVLEGATSKEITFSTYICHPSMANNELSGPLVAAFLYNKLKALENRYFTYRFIFTPETIGTIAYLYANGQKMKEKTHAGFVITCAGDDGPFTYKKTRQESSVTNKVVEHILKNYAKDNFSVVDFTPIGSDERQYCSPGFNLPIGSLMRTMYGKYKEYHTSADNKDFISFSALTETIEMYFKVCCAFELNHNYSNKLPFCEPQLGKRGLYPDISSTKGEKENWVKNILYILNYSDGNYSLLEIAEMLNISILELKNEVDKLLQNNLIQIN